MVFKNRSITKELWATRLCIRKCCTEQNLFLVRGCVSRIESDFQVFFCYSTTGKLEQTFLLGTSILSVYISIIGLLITQSVFYCQS